jgi:hypothetical protein
MILQGNHHHAKLFHTPRIILIDPLDDTNYTASSFTRVYGDIALVHWEL